MIDAENPFDSAHDTTYHSSYYGPYRSRSLIAHRHAVGDSSGYSLSISGYRERKCRNSTNRYHNVKSHGPAVPLWLLQGIGLAFTKEAIWRPSPAQVRAFQKAPVAKCR